MKYFTKELRAGSCDMWERACALYREEQEALRPYLSKAAQAFFFKVRRHDATVLSCTIGNRMLGRRGLRNFVEIRFKPEDSPYVYTLRYNSVSKYQMRFDSKEEKLDYNYDPPKPFVDDYRFLGYWLFDELSRLASGDFKHEIVLSEDDTVVVEFGSFSYTRKREFPS